MNKNASIFILKECNYIKTIEYIKYIMKYFYQIDNEKIYFFKNQYGKLFSSSNYKFNVSHTNNLIIICFCKQNIGIDAEYMHTIKNIDRISHLFNKMQNNKIILSKGRNKIKYFYIAWTCNESFLKWLGTGFIYSNKLFDFVINTNYTIQIKIPLLNKNSIKPNIKVVNYKNILISICSFKTIPKFNIFDLR